MRREAAMDENYACPCCGYLTLCEPPPGTFEICSVCRWEDGNVQARDPEFSGGANVICLREARESFRRIGAMSEEDLQHVRLPLPDEIPPSRQA